MIRSIYDISVYQTGVQYTKDDPFLISGMYRYANQDFVSSTITSFQSETSYGIATHTNGIIYPEFVWTHSYNISNTNEPLVNKIQFGNGYSQRIPDTINNNLLRFNLSFDGIKYQKMLAISHFLDARQGAKPFLWTAPPPYATRKLWICSKWEPKFIFYDNYSIAAEFQEVVA